MMGLKIASAEPPTFIISTFTPWMSASKFGTDKRKRLPPEIMGLMGLVTNGWGFIFRCPLVWSILIFFFQGGAMYIFVCNNWVWVERKSPCGMSFLWKSELYLLKWNCSRKPYGLSNRIVKRSSSQLLSKRWEGGSPECEKGALIPRGVGLVGPSSF